MKTRQAIPLLREAMIRNNTLVCCGLDPDLSKMPRSYAEYDAIKESNIFDFLKKIIDITNAYVCAYKIQKAFFDELDGGHVLLRSIIAYIQEHYPLIPVFIDAKVGDVENTMVTYFRNMFKNLRADGFVVNPYMGDDVVAPFARFPDKAGIVIVKTSNQGGSIIQDALMADGRPFWKFVLETMVTRWNGARNLIPVISSTIDQDLSDVRRIIPDDMSVLYAGFGLQGGTTQHLVELLDSQNQGVFVNSSRGILYPYEPADENWQNKVLESVITMRADLNMARVVSNRKFLLLLGPSGVGKSTIIQELRQLDDRFRYISPVITRELRPDESDKIAVTGSELDEMKRQGKLLVINELYGVRYGTPKEPIDQAFEEGNFPLLDWPVQKMDVMTEAFVGQTFTTYITPPSFEVMEQRLADGRDSDSVRLRAASDELRSFYKGDFGSVVNFSVQNMENEAQVAAQAIYRKYLLAIGEKP